MQIKKIIIALLVGLSLSTTWMVAVQPAQAASGKRIDVNLKTQTLTYSENGQVVGSFKISSGLPKTPTPRGTYRVLVKRPTVNYIGRNYRYLDTKWNLMFKRGKIGNYYIHGAYWHNRFGRPASHGCVNVSYANMEGLYNWADVGTLIVIK